MGIRVSRGEKPAHVQSKHHLDEPRCKDYTGDTQRQGLGGHPAAQHDYPVSGHRHAVDVKRAERLAEHALHRWPDAQELVGGGACVGR